MLTKEQKLIRYVRQGVAFINEDCFAHCAYRHLGYQIVTCALFITTIKNERRCSQCVNTFGVSITIPKHLRHCLESNR